MTDPKKLFRKIIQDRQHCPGVRKISIKTEFYRAWWFWVSYSNQEDKREQRRKTTIKQEEFPGQRAGGGILQTLKLAQRIRNSILTNSVRIISKFPPLLLLNTNFSKLFIQKGNFFYRDVNARFLITPTQNTFFPYSPSSVAEPDPRSEIRDPVPF